MLNDVLVEANALEEEGSLGQGILSLELFVIFLGVHVVVIKRALTLRRGRIAEAVRVLRLAGISRLIGQLESALDALVLQFILLHVNMQLLLIAETHGFVETKKWQLGLLQAFTVAVFRCKADAV